MNVTQVQEELLAKGLRPVGRTRCGQPARVGSHDEGPSRQKGRSRDLTRPAPYVSTDLDVRVTNRQ
jgi:hypothetical protein